MDELDLDRVPYCPMCIFELASKLRNGRRIHYQTLAATTRLTWREVEPGVRRELARARRRGAAGAEAALAEVVERGAEHVVARAVVLRLAERMASEMRTGGGDIHM